MNIKKLFIKHSVKKSKPLDARVFWQWCVVSFLILFLVAIGGSTFLFRESRIFAETPVEISSSNTDQILIKMEKRIDVLNKLVVDRTHTISTNAAPSQN